MPATVLVINPDDADRRWIASSLASTEYVVEFFADEAALFARLPAEEPACLVAFAEPDADAALVLVREACGGAHQRCRSLCWGRTARSGWQ